MEEKRQRMKTLVEQLNAASKAYYQEDREEMSNFEYDCLYDELLKLETETGIVLSSSPSHRVGYESQEDLPKERHEIPMLSLDKTKDVETLTEFVGDQRTLLSWKLDGLTIVLTYRGGELVKAVTRGNGEVGEVVTPNARVFTNIPLHISFKGELILRGEAVISYSDFEKINQEVGDADAKYKNPRNLCSGSVRQLNNEITARRRVRFYAFSLVKADQVDFQNSHDCELEWLEKQGFETVEHRVVTRDTVEASVQYFAEKIVGYDIPSDGLVAVYDDIDYGRSLGTTAKFPRDSIAFKWADEIRETHLLEIEWSPSRTGLINPVAVFEPVELEGTTVSRASVHNLSILKGLELGIGDEIRVYKANMIIPQIEENLTRSGKLPIPENCPVCKGETRINKANGIETLVCTNPECQAKKIKAFTLFVSRDAMNIDGLSEATLEKLIGLGFIKELADIFRLEVHKESIEDLEGFGKKSCENLLNSIEKARDTTLARLLYSLGIPGIGAANAKVLCRAFDYDLDLLKESSLEELTAIDGIGAVLAQSIQDYFRDEKKQEELRNLLRQVRIGKEQVETEDQILKGKSFVITGSVQHFANRKELKAFIEERGGKVTGAVTSKTDYLINNDTASNSSKNKKAKELGVPILSEEDFLRIVGE